MPRLLQRLELLTALVGHERIAFWNQLIANASWDAFVEDILVNHYDAAYATAATRHRGARSSSAAAATATAASDPSEAEPDTSTSTSTLVLSDTEESTYAAAAEQLLATLDPAALKITHNDDGGDGGD